jgi:TonB family protein
VAAAALLAGVLAASPALAQHPPIEPPQRVDTTPVPYPASGQGHAEVVLELVIAVDGAVQSSRVLDGSEPYASAAVAASSTWRFSPALRDGKPVASRVRVRVGFDPPEKPSDAVAPGSPTRTLRPGPTSIEPGVAEVTVHGVRLEPGAEEMSAGEVRQMPGSFGDAFRAIEALPGVTPILSGLPYFLVRGAPPGNTGFFIDGVRVPGLFHVGVGEAVLHPGLVDRVDFYRGGYPAHFGRYTGGILAGEVVPTPDKPHAEANLRILDAGGLVSTPLSGGRADALVAGRYGYPGPVLSLFAPNVGLSYWDYQTRVQWRPTDRDTLGAFVFGSYDSLSESLNGGPMHELIGYQFHRVDLRWDKQTSRTGSLRVAVTLGYDRSAGSNSLDQTTGTWSTSFVESGVFGARAKWSDALSEELEVGAGADGFAQPYHISVPSQSPAAGGFSGSVLGTTNADFDQTDVNAGAYGELVWRPSRRVEVRPGVRADLFSSYGAAPSSIPGFGGTTAVAAALDPRLSARWQMTDGLAWISALGIAHQASNIPLPSPGLEFSQLQRGLQASYQTSEGVEAQLPADFTATLDGFVHNYTGLADYYESCPNGSSSCNFDGRSYGLELWVRRPLTRRFTGWLSYTLSRTERDAFYRGQWVRVLSNFDRTHVANAVVAADLGKRWRAGVRVVAYSGLPYSSTGRNDMAPDARGPPFVRLDARLEKKWKALGGTFTFVLEGLNVLLNKESIGTSCSITVAQGSPMTQCQPNSIGPITIPSIGVDGAW